MHSLTRKKILFKFTKLRLYTNLRLFGAIFHAILAAREGSISLTFNSVMLLLKMSPLSILIWLILYMQQ